METAVYVIKYKDGRKFNVFCENKTQKKKVLRYISENKDKIISSGLILNGLHGANKFLKIAKTI